MGRTGLAAVAVALLLAACSDDSNPIKPDQSTNKDVPTLSDLIREATQPVEARAGDAAKGDAAKRDGAKSDGAKGDAAASDGTLTADGPAMCGKIRCDCTFFSAKQNKYIPLFGLAKEATTPTLVDFKVRVFFNGQLRVKQVTGFLPATKCGEWKTPGAGQIPAFTYQVVQVAEDFTVAWDNTFPGINPVACPNCK